MAECRQRAVGSGQWAEQLAVEDSHLKPQALAEIAEWVFKHKSPSPVTYFLQLHTPPKAVQIAPPAGLSISNAQA